ncbi:MAG: ribosome maturation factor RimP [Rhodospirillales bacterium]|nr:ribosome maturation factor RimP [Rhodospirillales bacterium]MSP80705.1 ribosome maturation factor RimP [Rhodospirillales bacterium]
MEANRPEADRGEAAPFGALRLEGLIVPTLEAMGYAMVRILVSGRHAPLVQVMAERADGQPMNVDACAEISRALSALLDVEDPIAGSYTLEVSSPGMDRPLIKAADFDRFKGRMAKIETRRPRVPEGTQHLERAGLSPRDGGRKRFQGRLAGMDAGGVRLETPEGPVTIAVDEIVRAKLVIDDALLRESLHREAHPASRDRKRG